MVNPRTSRYLCASGCAGNARIPVGKMFTTSARIGAS